MAEKKATLIIELKDMATNGLESLREAFKKLAEEGLGVTLSIAGIVAGLMEAFKSFADLEQATNRLDMALRSQGSYTKEYSQGLIELAEHVQATTRFSKESSLETLRLLSTFGLAGSELRKANSAALDLATGLGIDLRTATMLVGKAWEGQTQTLQRYGIQVVQSSDRTTKFNEAMSQIAKKFGGDAQADVNSYEGKIAQLGNRFNELKVKLGDQLQPVADVWLSWISKAIDKVGAFVASEENNLKGRQLTIEALQKEQLQLGLTAQSLERYHDKGQLVNDEVYNQTIEKLGKVNKALEREQALLAAQKPKKEKEPPSKNPIPFSQSEFDIKLAEVQGFGEKVADLQMKQYVKQKFDKEHAAKAELLLTTFYHQQELKGAADFFKNLSSLQNSKNKEMQIIGKTAAVGEATVNTYLSATKAYTAMAGIPVIGPALGEAAAAAAIIAGLANVAQISGINFAEGGMVLPTNGGTLATIGEAGSREAVIPLDDPKTKSALRDVMGGGVTVNVGTLVADQAGLEEFARRLDQVFFRLKRNNQMVSI